MSLPLMNGSDTIYSALRKFASSVTEKMGQITHGEPEDQLRAPFETFMNDAAAAYDLSAVGNLSSLGEQLR